MSDEDRVGFEGQEEGTPPEAAQVPEQVTPPEQQPEPITQADFDAFKEDVKSWLQKRTDSTESRAKKQIDERMKQLEDRFDLLKTVGVQLSDADKNAERRRAAMEVFENLVEEDDMPVPAGRQPAPIADESKVNEVNVKAAKLVAEHGFTISASDPENKELEELMKSNPDPDTWYAGWEKVMTSKAARLAKPPVAPAARMPSLATGGASPAGSREQQLLQELDTLQHRPDFAQKVNIDRRKEILKELDGLEGG